MIAGRLKRSFGVIARGEDAVSTVAVTGIILLPLVAVMLRRLFGTEISFAVPFTKHLTLVVGLVGAAIAAREGRLLTIATGTMLPEGRARRVAAVFVAFVGTLVTALLFVGALQMLDVHREAGREIALGIPLWFADVVFVVAFTLIAARMAWNASPSTRGRIIAALGFAAGLWLAKHAQFMEGTSPWIWVALLVGAGVLGMPIFALFGGLAAVLYVVQGGTPASVIISGYGQLISTDLPAIVLFAVAGCLLAEGRAPERMLRFFRGWVGWMPGGTAPPRHALRVFRCSLADRASRFSRSAVLLPALADGYRERFSTDAVSSGSLGILFPLALPSFYGIVASVPVASCSFAACSRSGDADGAGCWGRARVDHPRTASGSSCGGCPAWKRSESARPSSSSVRCWAARRPCSRRPLPRFSRWSHSASCTATCRTGRRFGA
jgi:TRAP-type C4-dicarboxylate transport system permease small subunit